MLEFCHDAAEKTSFFCICCSKICKLQIKFLSLQRQWLSIDYPGRIPREGKALSILPILKELLWQLFLFYVFCYEQFMENLALHIFSQDRNACPRDL